MRKKASFKSPVLYGHYSTGKNYLSPQRLQVPHSTFIANLGISGALYWPAGCPASSNCGGPLNLWSKWYSILSPTSGIIFSTLLAIQNFSADSLLPGTLRRYVARRALKTPEPSGFHTPIKILWEYIRQPMARAWTVVLYPSSFIHGMFFYPPPQLHKFKHLLTALAI